MNIDLATFNIDTTQLFQKLVQTREEIARLRIVQRDLQREFVNSNRAVATNQATLDRLNTELQGLTRGTASYNQTLALRDQAEQRLNDSLLEQTRINATYQEQLTANSLELNRLSNQSRSYQTVLDAQNRATNESIDLYSRQRAELTLLQREQRELGVQLAAATREGNTAEINRLSVAYRNASESADGLARELRDIDMAGGNSTSTIGRYREALDDLKSSLLSGDLAGARGAFDGITTSIKGMITQSLAFIATPIGAAITALAGIGLAAKAVFDFNEGVKESNTLLKSLGVSSGEISKVRTELEATAETYGKSFEDIAKTADSLASSYGISISEANDIIAKGLAQGGAGSEDFLNQISEYDVQFQELGFTAEESLAVIQKGFEEGVQTDKLPDAIKEVGISLRDISKAGRDVLEDSFGKAFSDELLKGIKDGSITTKDALTQIGNESKKVGLDLEQQQKITSDLFRGAGEDAGGALKIIELLTDAQTRGLSETEQAYEDLRLANERYNKVQSQLFEIENFGSVWANIKAEALNFFVDVIDYVLDLKTQIQPLIDLVGVVFTGAWKLAQLVFKQYIKDIGIGLKFISDSIAFIADLPRKISNAFIIMKNVIITAIQAVVNTIKPILSALGVDIDNFSKRLTGLKGKTADFKPKPAPKKKVDETETAKKDKADAPPPAPSKPKEPKANTKIADAQKGIDDAKKKVEDAQKAEIDSLQKLNDEKVKFAKIELDSYIEKNKSILDNEKFLTQELLKQENERLKNLQKAKLEQEKLEFDTQNKILNDKISNIEKDKTLNQTQKNELEILKLQQKELEIQYNSDVAKINEDTQKQVTANETRYSNERIEAEKVRKAIQYQTELLDLEAKGATEQEIKLAQQEQTYQLELEKYAQKLSDEFKIKLDSDANNQITQDEINLARQELEAEQKLITDEKEKIRFQTQLDALTNLERNNAKAKKQIDDEAIKSKIQSYGRMFGDIAGLFGQETAVAKAAGIAQAGINTYLGVTNVLADKTVPTFIKPIFVATTIATGLQSVAKISGIKGFADGGYTGDGGKYQPAGVVHKGEVVFSQEDVKQLGGAMVVDAMRPTSGLRGYSNGGIVGLQSIQNQIKPTGIDTEALAIAIGEQVMLGAMAGTESGASNGIGNYQENISIRASASF
jgi:hypothetical protein